jgi:hypothetical protein
MTLPSSGSIAMSQVNTELGLSSTAQISFNDTTVRTLTGTSAGTALILPTNFYGKTHRITLSYTFTSSTPNASLNVTSLSGYVAGISDITITVNSGVYLYATTTSNAGLTLSGGTSGDTITLVNNGYIAGQGGSGGGSTGSAIQATPGGVGLSLGFNTTVNNTNSSAYIGGGGGGGGFGYNGNVTYAGGGGGAGGGTGGAAEFNPGGSGAHAGGTGSAGTNTSGTASGGGGGGVFPGTGGASVTVPTIGSTGQAAAGNGGGAGGGGAAYYSGGKGALYAGGGGGGGWGASGGQSLFGGNVGGAGGSANGSGGTSTGPGAGNMQPGGSGGNAVALNGHTVTWVSGNTTRVYGAVS